MSLNVFVSVNGEGEGVLDGPDPADDPADDLGVEAEDVRDDAPGTTVSSPHRFHIFEDVDAEVDPGSHGQNPAVLTNAETNGVTVANRGGGLRTRPLSLFRRMSTMPTSPRKRAVRLRTTINKRRGNPPVIGETEQIRVYFLFSFSFY